MRGHFCPHVPPDGVLMAFLQTEIVLLQGDVTSTQTMAQTVTNIAANIGQSITSFNPLAVQLTGYSTQLSRLATTVRDLPSALQAVMNATQIWSSARTSQQRMLQPARQVWSTVAAFEQQRSITVQNRWTATHAGTPTSSAIALHDPLLQALTNYLSFTSRLDADVQTGVNAFPPAPVPSPLNSGADVVMWLQRGSAELNALASELSHAVDQLTTTQSWSSVETAAAAAVTLAEGQLALAQRVATALGGSQPPDPTTLASRIADLVELRLRTCPDPVLPADRALYRRRSWIRPWPASWPLPAARVHPYPSRCYPCASKRVFHLMTQAARCFESASTWMISTFTATIRG
jgi:hypothetical protein